MDSLVSDRHWRWLFERMAMIPPPRSRQHKYHRCCAGAVARRRSCGIRASVTLLLFQSTFSDDAIRIVGAAASIGSSELSGSNLKTALASVSYSTY